MVGDLATRPLAVYVDTVPDERRPGPAMLREAGFEVREAVAVTMDEVLDAGRGATALLVGDSPVPRAVIDSLDALAIVATLTVGVDHVDLAAAAERGVWVANVPDATTEEVATTSLAMALGLVRHLPFLDRHVREGGWDCFSTGPRRRPSTLTLGIIGVGRTGRALARLAAPVFGRIVGADPAPAPGWPDGVDRVGLDELLGEADVVALHAPAVPGAPPVLDAAAIGRLRRGAYVVNVARGSLLDLDALLGALDEGRVAGAALDVLPTEPPPAGHPVLRHPRVLVTPHGAFWSLEGADEAERKQAANVVAWRRDGRPLTPVVEGTR